MAQHAHKKVSKDSWEFIQFLTFLKKRKTGFKEFDIRVFYKETQEAVTVKVSEAEVHKIESLLFLNYLLLGEMVISLNEAAEFDKITEYQWKLANAGE